MTTPSTSPELHKTLKDIIGECKYPGTTIHIQPLTRGYKVEIGCASFAFERLGDMIQAVNLFLDDSIDAQTAYNDHMNELVGGDNPAPEMPCTDFATVNEGRMRGAAVRIGYPEETTPG